MSPSFALTRRTSRGGCEHLADRPGLGLTRSEVATALTVFRHVLLVGETQHLRGRRYGNVVLAASRRPLPVADLTRRGFVNGDISTVMSPRTVISWAQNALIFGDIGFAFRVSFLNKCDESERPIVAEYYQRVFGTDLPESAVASTEAAPGSNVGRASGATVTKLPPLSEDVRKQFEVKTTVAGVNTPKPK